jgi:hypothetical protein
MPRQGATTRDPPILATVEAATTGGLGGTGGGKRRSRPKVFDRVQGLHPRQPVFFARKHCRSRRFAISVSTSRCRRSRFAPSGSGRHLRVGCVAAGRRVTPRAAGGGCVAARRSTERDTTRQNVGAVWCRVAEACVRFWVKRAKESCGRSSPVKHQEYPAFAG